MSALYELGGGLSLSDQSINGIKIAYVCVFVCVREKGRAKDSLNSLHDESKAMHPLADRATNRCQWRNFRVELWG